MSKKGKKSLSSLYRQPVRKYRNKKGQFAGKGKGKREFYYKGFYSGKRGGFDKKLANKKIDNIDDYITSETARDTAIESDLLDRDTEGRKAYAKGVRLFSASVLNRFKKVKRIDRKTGYVDVYESNFIKIDGSFDISTFAALYYKTLKRKTLSWYEIKFYVNLLYYDPNTEDYESISTNAYLVAYRRGFPTSGERSVFGGIKRMISKSLLDTGIFKVENSSPLIFEYQDTEFKDKEVYISAQIVFNVISTPAIKVVKTKRKK